MKTLKKIVSLSLIMTMIITTLLTNCAFAAIEFNDVNETTAYSEAIYNLVEDGVLNGYDNEDGSKSFKPEASITRAEFAKVIVVAKFGANVLADATKSKFNDMEGHWSVKYVEYASGSGIINGYEDGSFKPEKSVTYAEAVKMIVCALGYGAVVEVTQPWYQGYINIANSIGLTKGAVGLAENAAVRGLVAQLIDNMGDCKNLVQSAVGADGTPIYSNNNSNTVLGDDVYEGSGVLIGVYDNSLKGTDDQLNMGRINISEIIYELDPSIDYLSLTDLIGHSVTFEYYTKSMKNYIKSVRSANNTDIYTVDGSLIDSFDGSKLYYYEDEDAYETSYYTLDNDIYVVYNGYGVDKSNINATNLTTWLTMDTGSVTMYNNDSDKDIDVIYIDKYEIFYAQAPVTSNGVTTIKDQITPTKTVTLDEDDVIVTKVSSHGGSEVTAKLTSITKNNVVSVAIPLGQNAKTVVKISSATASGVVSTIGEDYEDVMIGTTEYKFTDYFRDLVSSNPTKYGFDMGANVKFYLDFTGRVVYAEVTVSEIPYGYLIDYVESSDIDAEGVTLRFVNASNKIETAELKDRVRLNGTSVDESDVIQYLAASASRIEAPKSADYKAPASAGKEVISQLIKYKMGTENGSKVIDELYTVSSTATSQDTEDGGIIPTWTTLDPDANGDATAFASGDNKYKVSGTGTKSFQLNGVTQFNVNTDTIVFKLPKGRADVDQFRRSKGTGNFSDGSSYCVEAYDVESKKAKVVVYYTSSTSTGSSVYANTNSYVVINKTQTQNDAGKTVDKIDYIKLGDSVLNENGESAAKSVLSEDLNQTSGIAKGDIVKFASSSGEIDVIEKLFAISDKKVYKDGTTELTDGYLAEKYNSKTEYFQAHYGKVSVMDIGEDGVGDISVFKGETQEEVLYNITADTKYYTLDTRGNVEDSGYGLIVDADSSDYDSATEIFVVSYDDKVRGIYIMPVAAQQ